jgi:hypothetical protein
MISAKRPEGDLTFKEEQPVISGLVRFIRFVP